MRNDQERQKPLVDTESRRRQPIGLAAWGLVVLAPNIAWLTVSEQPLEALLYGTAPALAFLSFLAAWLRKPIWLFRLSLPFLFLLPFEIYYILLYRRPSDVLVLGAVLESNPTEAMEYLGAGDLSLLAFLGILLGVVFWRAAPHATPLPLLPVLWWLRTASLAPLLLYFAMEQDWSARENAFFNLPAAQAANMDTRLMTDLETPTEVLLAKSYPIGVPLRVAAYLRERSRIRSVAKTLAEVQTGASRTNRIEPPEVYVLVIGESVRPDHLQLNGYHRPTTPRLTRADGIISFRNVVSPWSATRLAVPVLLTGRQAKNGRAPIDAASIVQVFAQAGFHTYWLSNQPPLGLHDSVISVHAQTADTAIFTNPGGISSAPYDEVILPAFRRLFAQPGPRKFFIVHLMGSHKEYARRYPKQFRVFAATNGEDSVATYDDSIRYTDHVLGEILSVLSETPRLRAAMLYVSDHGETLPKAGCTLSGHALGTEDDYRVAALLWVSERLEHEAATMLKRLRSRENAPLYSRGAMHTLLHLAGITFNGFREEESWASGAWRPTIRWNNVARDFDRATRKGPCKRLTMH